MLNNKYLTSHTQISMSEKEESNMNKILGINNFILRSPFTPYIVTTSMDYKIRVLTLFLHIKGHFQGHKGFIQCLISLPNKHIATGSWDGSIKIWSVIHKLLKRTLSSHRGEITSLTQIGEYKMASCAKDRLIKIWELKTWECVHTLQGYEDIVLGMDYNKLTNSLLVAHRNEHIVWWGNVINNQFSPPKLVHELGQDGINIFYQLVLFIYHNRYGVAGIYTLKCGFYIIAFHSGIKIYNQEFALIQNLNPKHYTSIRKAVCLMGREEIVWGNEQGEIGRFYMREGLYSGDEVMKAHIGPINGIIHINENIVVTVGKEGAIKCSHLGFRSCKGRRILGDSGTVAITNIVRI